MKYADTLRARVETLVAERDALRSEADTLTPDETRDAAACDARADEIVARAAAIKTELAETEARLAELAELETRAEASKSAPTFIRQPEKVAVTDVRSMSRSEARDASMRILDAASDKILGATRAAGVQRLIETQNQNVDGSYLAKRMLLTESPEYRTAFMKMLANPSSPGWDTEEVRAVNEFRAMSIGVDTAGGFGVPVLIDPTILITTGTGATPLLGVSRIEVITTDAWRGVSAAAAAWSFDAEAAAVSDDSITTAQPSVTAHMARGYIPYSIEFGQDYPNAASELGRAMEFGYQDLIATKMATGSGTNEPWGIFTALDANTNAEVTVTTNAQFGAVDIDKIWAALPERWRARASWFMSVGYENAIRGFGSGTATSRFTVDQTREGISLLNGKPVLLSDYAPAVATTTTARNILVVGDFSNYVVAQRAGMSVEVLPLVTDVTNNRPTGERGLFAYARVGADSVIDTAFRVLTNT
jgi:HK97 family phage major capsid protein